MESEFSREIFDGMLEEVFKYISGLQEKCYERLKACFGENDLKLPIDIKKVAESMGVKIGYENLNITLLPISHSVDGGSLDLNIAQLRYEMEKGNIKAIIFVDTSKARKEKDALSNLEKYAVAYELGKLILSNGKRPEIREINRVNMLSIPYSLPRLSAKLDNFEYEMCAIFLLLPMKQFLKEFDSYLHNAKERPVDMEEWISYLSKKAEIPYYQLVNGYEYIKFCAYEYYKENLAEEPVSDEAYRWLYNV